MYIPSPKKSTAENFPHLLTALASFSLAFPWRDSDGSGSDGSGSEGECESEGAGVDGGDEEVGGSCEGWTEKKVWKAPETRQRKTERWTFEET